MNLGRKGNLMPTLQDPGLSTLDGVGLCPSFDLDFTQGKSYGHRIAVPAAPTAARASSALFFQNIYRQIAIDGDYTTLYGNNVLRYGNNDGHSSPYEINQNWIGLLVEGADQNVIVENTQYAALNWTLGGGPTVTDDTTVKLYNGRCFKIVNGAAGEDYMFQTALLTGEDYFICFLVQFGTGLGDANVRVAAGVSGAIAGIASTHEQVGFGMYLVWATFTATAANWDIGVNVRGNKTVFLSLLTCCKIAPTNEGGAFPRSPIPSGAAATTRVAESLTYPATNNIQAARGTLDVQAVAPCSEAQASSELAFFSWYINGSNYMRLALNAATNQVRFRYRGGGAASAEATGSVGFSRGNIVKLRAIWNCDAKLDGTNYVIIYDAYTGSDWAQLAVTATQPTAIVGANNLRIGHRTGNIAHLTSPIRRVRIYPEPIVGVPGW